MYTKQQIFSRYISPVGDISNRDALEAMEVYSLEVAIPFAEWLTTEAWIMIGEGVWRTQIPSHTGTKTTKELFQMFMKQSTKQ